MPHQTCDLPISHDPISLNYLRRRRRNRREPAIWGEPAGDYSLTVLEDRTIFMHALLFVDNKISKHYRTNIEMKHAILLMIQEANEYFYQLNIRIIIVDILETNRSDLNLYTFESYRNSILNKLPRHDFAVLIAHKYAGGLAFVGGLCNDRPIMLCGFYSQKPEAMGSIFFHEVGHLVGLPHIEPNKTLIVPNCKCKESKEKGYFEKNNCLKIPGYDHECTVQSMINHVYGAHCINYKEPYVDLSKVQPVCGNGLLEGEEECDCGTSKSCINFNCNAKNCKRHIKSEHIIGALTLSTLFVLIVIILMATRTIHSVQKDKFITKICDEKYTYLFNHIKINSTTGHTLSNNRNSINNYHTNIKKSLISRPKVPPPPPPQLLISHNDNVSKPYLLLNGENDLSESSSETTVTTVGTLNEEKNTGLNSNNNINLLKDEKFCHDNISLKFEDFDSTDDDEDENMNNQMLISNLHQIHDTII
uniref:Peptidase M12B domain-containing protein n=1 Tax=Parastrongyloides trichosuri TaxID=131310 RepID=A0A0N4ZA07_PARTI